MRILIVTPAPAGSRKGNRITAERWAGFFRELGHRADIKTGYAGESCDVLLALHALKSFESIRAFHDSHPDRPLILALTGTDVYRDIHTEHRARQSLDRARLLVVLQPLAIRELPRRLRPRARVVYQSVDPPEITKKPGNDTFDVCVMGHLRPVKDPFRAAFASRMLPETSRIRVIQVGEALTGEMAAMARAEEEQNPRYRWTGDLPRRKAMELLARSKLLVLSSEMEGGANVISEAVAAGVPVIASRISGSMGLLKPGYPGFFPVGNTRALARILTRVEQNPGFYRILKQRCLAQRPLFRPAREKRTWRSILREVI